MAGRCELADGVAHIKLALIKGGFDEGSEGRICRQVPRDHRCSVSPVLDGSCAENRIACQCLRGGRNTGGLELSQFLTHRSIM